MPHEVALFHRMKCFSIRALREQVSKSLLFKKLSCAYKCFGLTLIDSFVKNFLFFQLVKKKWFAVSLYDVLATENEQEKLNVTLLIRQRFTWSREGLCVQKSSRQGRWCAYGKSKLRSSAEPICAVYRLHMFPMWNTHCLCWWNL